MESIFSTLFANFLSDWQIKNHPYKTACVKVSFISFVVLIALLLIHYHNFTQLTETMILADLMICGIVWLLLLVISFFFIKIRQILKDDLRNPQ